MTITIKDCHIENCGTGISTDGNIQLDISRTRIINCKKAIDHRDPPGIIQALGLPSTTPSKLLVESLELLLEKQNEDPEHLAQEVSKTDLFQYLGGAANATTILSNLISLQQNGYIQAVLNLLPR